MSGPVSKRPKVGFQPPAWSQPLVPLEPVPPSGYSNLERLGSGAYGTVYSADWSRRIGGQVRSVKVALKHVEGLLEKDTERCYTTALRTLREIAILRHCKHPQIVQLHEVHQPSSPGCDNLWLSLELCWKDLSYILSCAHRVRGWGMVLGVWLGR